MATYSAFDGAVTFDCTTPNLKTLVIRDQLGLAVPEHVTFLPGSQGDILFQNLTTLLGRTKTITFTAGDPPPELQALTAFWEMASGSVDYRRIWDEFLYLSLNVHNEWLRAIEAADNIRLLAPAEVQPGAPDPEAETDDVKKNEPSST
jgi:hypothetical protein